MLRAYSPSGHSMVKNNCLEVGGWARAGRRPWESSPVMALPTEVWCLSAVLHPVLCLHRQLRRPCLAWSCLPLPEPFTVALYSRCASSWICSVPMWYNRSRISAGSEPPDPTQCNLVGTLVPPILQRSEVTFLLATAGDWHRWASF